VSVERDLKAAAARLAREERGQVATPFVRCDTHGASYACPGAHPYHPRGYGKVAPSPEASCGHIACRRILAGECPECPASIQSMEAEEDA
jgi:hypothetical protein